MDETASTAASYHASHHASYPASLRLGALEIAPAVLLAPMESLTDLTFRRLLRAIGGVGLTCTEFVASEALIRDVPRVEEMALLDPSEKPAAIQIYGKKPASMAEAARRAVDLGAAVVDINMGCPARKVVAHSGGVALMRDPALVGAIVAAVRAAVSVPVTVKMRAGFDAASRNAVQIARICEDEGADGVTVHWRTRVDGFAGTLDLGPIADVRSALRIPVIGNGDVCDVASARRMFDQTGCQAVMVGRGAIRDPFLPLRIANDLAGLPPPVVEPERRLAFLLDYVDGIQARFRTEFGALGRIKKFCAYYTRGLPGGKALREKIFHAQDLGVVRDLVAAFFESAQNAWDGGGEAMEPLPGGVVCP
jgi:tRNA-dihydrouridine synthase B